VREAKAQYFPTLGVSASLSRQRVPGSTPAGTIGSQGHPAAGFVTYTEYSLPFDASWTPDLWARVRNTVTGDVAAAQASAADLENTRLTEHAELAVDYYALRAQDSLIKLLDDTVLAYEQALAFTQAQFDTGVGTAETVAQSQVQLDTARAQATGLRISRAQYEHAIALLIGQAASTFTLAAQPLHAEPPAVPIGLPSQLLERRPDIAANERLMAQANAQIGLARAAYFPTLTLSGAAGFESTSASSWIDWPSRVWSVGPSLAETLFDAGLRRATVEQYRAAYDQTVANYRQAVLTAFQQVEDNLAALRLLTQEVAQQDAAVKSAQRFLAIATDRYKLGLDPYLNVITAQTALLNTQQSAVNLQLQQLTDSVQLIEALGGGWQAAQLPTPDAITERSLLNSP